MIDQLLEPVFRDYSLRNLQARIVANLFIHKILAHEPDSQPFVEEIKETLELVTAKITE